MENINTFRSALHCIALLAFFTGCSQSPPESEANVNALVATVDADRDASASGFGVSEHDFGAVPARGQILSYEFPLINQSRRAVRIFKASALTPCLSAVGPLPNSIAANGRAKLPIVFKPGFQTGRKQVRFVVETDDLDRPTWWFAASANLFAEVEAIEAGDSNHVLPLNHAGSARLTLVCRRLGKEGRSAPDSLFVAEPLSARFLGEPEEKLLDEGLVETRRSLEITLPALKTVGSHRDEIVFRWADGRDFKQTIFRQTIAPITAEPPGFVLKSREGRRSKTVLVRAIDRPFRIVGVSGPSLAEPPPLSDEPKRMHVLQLDLDPSRSPDRVSTDLILSTDHPDQPSLSLSVLVFSVDQEETP